MTEQLMDIPHDLREPFKRMIGLLPKAMRDDEFKQQAALTFLKVGGERLALHYVKISTLLYKDSLASHKGLFGTRPAPPPPPEPVKKDADKEPEAADEKDANADDAPKPAEKVAPPSEPMDDFYM